MLSRRCIAAMALTVVFVLSTAALANGADWLGAMSPVGIPVGNLVAWAMLVSLNALPFLLAGSFVSLQVRTTLLVLAAAWFPVSFLLFGNAHLNNADPLEFRVWLGYTAALVLAPVSLLVAAVVRTTWKKMGNTMRGQRPSE